MLKNCPKCNIEFDDFSIWKPKQFCSRKCANSRGPRTPDFKTKVSKKLTGRKLSEERKLKTSGEKNGQYKGDKAYTFSCLHCEQVITSKRKKKGIFCSKKCWSDNIQLNRTAFENYKSKCLFNFDVFDYPDKFDLSLIKSHGWYSPVNKGNNINGVSKDHKFSIRQGFTDNIDPYYISHPCNCEIMLHISNQKKNSKCSITFEELKKLVEDFECERGGMATHRIANP